VRLALVPKPTDAQRRTDLENKLKSSVKAQVDQAWIAEDGEGGEMHFYLARDFFAPLTDHTTQTMELINIARAFKRGSGLRIAQLLRVVEPTPIFE
jgi:hypothetical protein